MASETASRDGKLYSDMEARDRTGVSAEQAHAAADYREPTAPALARAFRRQILSHVLSWYCHAHAAMSAHCAPALDTAARAASLPCCCACCSTELL